ncbi:MAG: hypothetical protein C0466_15375 [Candidatus Accumulibacter sp.]|nr:hypothetical protein [Accumulibacter sp.]
MAPSRRKDDEDSTPSPPQTGYSEAARTVLQETSARVQEMHGAIAARSFDVLQKIPLVAGPATLVRHAHDAIAGSVYAAIRFGGGGLLGLAAQLENGRRQAKAPALPPKLPPDRPNRLASSPRSALNAAFGDHLAGTRSVLAIPMAIHRAGHAVPLTRTALAAAFPAAGERLCLFIHGLAYDERCWDVETPGDPTKETNGVDIPRRLAAELGYSTLALRYNSGLPIVENGAQLAVLLEALLAEWPCVPRELVIVGHSMGGLIARSACAQAGDAGLSWPGRTRMVICLGSPHLGSPLERLGHLATTALGLSTITAPLARVAAQRSQGIQDLRHGVSDGFAKGIAWRFVGGSLAEDPENPLGELIGDGLVTLGSATVGPLDGDVLSVRLGGVGHMGLLHDERVYRQIREWLQDTKA